MAAIEITRGSENVFLDLNLKNPTESKLKSEVVMAILDLMDEHGLTQAEVSRIAGIDAGALSMTMRGRTSRISTGRLIEIYTKLGGTVEVEFTSPESLPRRVQEAR